MVPGLTDAQVDLFQLPDLTGELKLVRIAGTGSLSVVYRCSYYAQSMDVAVKAITFPPSFHQTEKEELLRKVRREFAIWRRLEHPNIVPLLGTAYGKGFGSDLPCIVSRWMNNGTLFEYVNQSGTTLSHAECIQLVKGSVAGVNYLHAQGIFHGHLHPGNILIDDGHNPRLIDFAPRLGLDQLSPGPVLWTAPESLYPDLYLKLEFQATLQNDIYSLGSIMLFILSGQYPWKSRGDAENKLKEFQNPPRPVWPVNIPDGVWNFIERCWSPRDPGNRPSAEEVLSFSTERLEQLFRPNPASDVNVVLFGALGSGKSSIVNLLAEKEVAQISSGAEPCTMRPRSYQISIDGNQIRLWDTMGFFLAHGPSSTSHLLPYEQAHAVLRNLPQGVNLIIICAPKGIITPSLRRLYWLINDFFYGGRAPIAFVVTHFDTPDEEWWGRNERDIAQRTSIPVQSIPHACVTTDPTGYLQSKHVLKELLQNYATTVSPIPLHHDFLSYTTASLDLVAQCRLTSSEGTALVKTFRGPIPVFNVVFFGAGTSEILNLITGHPEVETSPGAISYARSYRLSTGMQQFCIWDPMGVDKVHIDHGSYVGGLENACRLVRDLADKSGVDLLVFCKRCGRLTAEEISGYRLVEEILCKGQAPVAVVVTHVESRYPAEKWWGMNGRDLVKSIGGNVINHSCIPSLAGSSDSLGVELDEMRVESRLSIEAMLEDCVRSHNAGLSRAKSHINFLPKALTRKYAAYRKKRTVENVTARCGFTRGQAERLVQSYDSTIFG